MKEAFLNAISGLLGEDADPSMVGKLEAVFEAAVTDRVEREVAEIVAQLDEGAKEYLSTVTESLVEKVDDYLDYVVEEWVKDNAVAVEQGIKTTIAENFITGLKNLFENHYIDVPAEKYNVLDDLYAQNRKLQENLNQAVNATIELKKQVALTECAGIFVAETKDLADTQVNKLQSLMENVNFTTPEEYREKLVAIKENYMKRPISAPARVAVPEETFSKAVSVPSTLVEGYVSALGRMNKKV
jgi:dynactin complex subunit